MIENYTKKEDEPSDFIFEKETDIKKRQEQELIKSYKQDILNCQTDAEKQFLKDHLNLKICELYFYNIDRKIAS